jgi:hypothetical protein
MNAIRLIRIPAALIGVAFLLSACHFAGHHSHGRGHGHGGVQSGHKSKHKHGKGHGKHGRRLNAVELDRTRY